LSEVFIADVQLVEHQFLRCRLRLSQIEAKDAFDAVIAVQMLDQPPGEVAGGPGYCDRELVSVGHDFRAYCATMGT